MLDRKASERNPMSNVPDKSTADDTGSTQAGRRAVVACAVLEDELAALNAALDEPISVWRWVEPALHEKPWELREALQRAVDDVERTEPGVAEIVLGIGLCSRGLEGVTAQRCTLVAPRSDDCIGLLLGDAARYRDEVAQTPGTAWFSRGWIRHGVAPGPEKLRAYGAQLAERFSAEEVAYLVDMERASLGAYTRAVYVKLTIARGDDEAAHASARRAAGEMGWNFAEIEGDPAFLRALLAGPHDPRRFCTARPGESFCLSGDDGIIGVRASEAERL